MSSLHIQNGHTDKVTRRRRILKAFVAKAQANRSFAERFSDYVTETAGSIEFLIINIAFFFFWILYNIEIIPGITPFDVYPFGLLTMIVSLEAIILSVFVLLSQHRMAKIDSLREELHLQVNLIAEEEITKALEMLSDIRSKVGIKTEDHELTRMLERIDTSYIERQLDKQISSTSSNILKPPLPQLSNNQQSSEKKDNKESR
jgi:uncharacterized membrane protein